MVVEVLKCGQVVDETYYVRAQRACVMTITFLEATFQVRDPVGCSCSATRTSRIQYG